MGIRVRCPNGHELNVKSLLAGKRGVCPHCGARFQIPGQSHQDSQQWESGTQAAAAEPRGDSLNPDSPLPSVAEGAGRADHVSRTPEVDRSAAEQWVDPIAESPGSLWHVRPRSGQQYGPADAATIERWLAEGRVPADALVWRQGWPEWRTAASVFHQLRPADSAPNASTPLPSGSGAPLERPAPATPHAVPKELASQPPKHLEDRVASRPIHGSSRTGRRKRGSHRVALTVLLLAVAVLVPIAWYVITR